MVQLVSTKPRICPPPKRRCRARSSPLLLSLVLDAGFTATQKGSMKNPAFTQSADVFEEGQHHASCSIILSPIRGTSSRLAR